MAYRFSQLSGRLSSTNKLAAYRPQGIRATPSPATTVELQPTSAPKVSQEVRTRTTRAVPISAFENGLATGNESSAWYKYRNKIHKKRKENIQFNIKSIDEGKDVWAFKSGERTRAYVLVVLSTLAWIYNVYLWNTQFRKHEVARFGKVKF